MRYKRARLEIVCDILFFIRRSKNGAKSTHILYKANLSVPLLQKYLKALLADRLIYKIIIKNKRSVYKLTKHGVEFINQIKKIDKMTRIIEIFANRRIKI